MRLRIVVADQSEARFYDLEHAEAPLQLAGHLSDPKARLHDRDFKSDRPGRVFDRAAEAGRRRGASAHHSTAPERSPRKREAQLFARQIADHLEHARREGQFDRVVLIAGPSFLGALRAALPASALSAVLATVAKDLVHGPEQAVREHIPAEALEALAAHPPGER